MKKLFSKNETIVSRVGISPVGSGYYRICRLSFHLLAYSIYKKALHEGCNAKFVIRCDDTNFKNSNRKFLYEYLNVLNELNVKADLYPDSLDCNGYSLFQSERGDLYKKSVDSLLLKKMAFVDKTGAVFFDIKEFSKQFSFLLVD